VTSNLGAGSRSVLRTVKVNVALIDIASPGTCIEPSPTSGAYGFGGGWIIS
jgi:hypothetical protein